jgi:hypothetical protein
MALPQEGEMYYVRSFRNENTPKIRIRQVLRSEVSDDLLSGVVLYSYDGESDMYAVSGNAFLNAKTPSGYKRFMSQRDKDESEKGN